MRFALAGSAASPCGQTAADKQRRPGRRRDLRRHSDVPACLKQGCKKIARTRRQHEVITRAGRRQHIGFGGGIGNRDRWIVP